jgi:putative transposase
LKAIHVQEDRRSAEDKIGEVIAKLRPMRLMKAVELVGAKAHETLTYSAFPSNHWRQIKTNNHSSGSSARSAGARAWSEHFPTATQR